MAGMDAGTAGMPDNGGGAAWSCAPACDTRTERTL